MHHKAALTAGVHHYLLSLPFVSCLPVQASSRAELLLSHLDEAALLGEALLHNGRTLKKPASRATCSASALPSVEEEEEKQTRLAHSHCSGPPGPSPHACPVRIVRAGLIRFNDPPPRMRLLLP